MHQPGSAGEILEILRDGTPRTKRDLALLTGQARTTVAQRLAVLTDAGLVRETDEATATGGRPSAAYAFNADDKIVLAVDLGANHATCAVSDLFGEVLAHTTDAVPIAEGPQTVMGLVLDRLDALRSQVVELSVGPAVREVMAVGIGLPGPVAQDSGRPTSPPIMPGWDGYDVRRVLEERYGCPVFVDNDANVLALGERAVAWPGVQDLMYVKVATGIGAGIISGGRLLHGAEGAAGDLGHVYSAAAGERPCRCGNRGCLESLAGGMSIAATLTEQGIPAGSPRDVVDLVRAGNLESIHALREAGRAIGDVLAACTALFNPRVIVIGGEIVEVGEPLLAGVRESIYSRALPLASRNLRVTVAQSGALGGVQGASRMAIDAVFSAEHLDAALDRAPAAVG
ncbi:ROK family protein [Raineyella fluvialis]|uniref:ROK family protein n=2 Tax=Raineyella fluvialis TaxID=2662261 RepID=A0A5Q2FDC5_9ACTN|nr:ROK family protein [Raineyella fluvialis]